MIRREREAIGESDVFLDFQERLSQVAPVDRPVLLLGERGTGKELAAARLHYLSRRWEKPFVAVNCAALAPSVLESELFGHEAGAFTGATTRRLGRFEAAHEGTLFLDEVGQIPMAVQEKILRVVEYQSFERVGGSGPVEVDVRIVSATNADLPALAQSGRFKRDLLDRLAFEVLHLPPLRERRGDIVVLATHFASRMAHELGREEVPEFSAEALTRLRSYPWPGNVRELKNVVERSVCRASSALIEQIDFDPFRSPYVEASSPTEPAAAHAGSAEVTDVGIGDCLNFSDAIRAYEQRLMRQALERCRFNQRRAAETLGLSYHQFRGLYRKHRAS
jgi:psp operon transcriptional activator